MILEKDKLKEKLEQLRDIRKEISELTGKVNKLEPEAVVKDYVYKSSKYPPFTKHKVTIVAESPKLLQQLEEYKNLLSRSACELLEVQIECEKFISQLPTSRLRRIFRYRYIEQFSWRKIAYVIGGDTTTAESVRKEHDRFFKEN